MENIIVNFRKVLINFLIVFVIAVYQLASWKPNYNARPAYQYVLELFVPAQEMTSGVRSSFLSFIDNYFYLVDVKKNNKHLRQEVSELKSDLVGFEEVSLENVRLKKLFYYSEPKQTKKVFARVVAWDAFKDFRVVRLNQGELAGVQIQDAVVTADGLVGSIFTVSEHYSEVLLLNDVNSRVDVINRRTRGRGVTEGFNESQLILKYTELREDYMLNDVVMTAGLSFLPKGIPVAKVIQLDERAWGNNKKIYLKPVVDLSTLEDVVILTSAQVLTVPVSESTDTQEEKE